MEIPTHLHFTYTHTHCMEFNTTIYNHTQSKKSFSFFRFIEYWAEIHRTPRSFILFLIRFKCMPKLLCFFPKFVIKSLWCCGLWIVIAFAYILYRIWNWIWALGCLLCMYLVCTCIFVCLRASIGNIWISFAFAEKRRHRKTALEWEIL